MSVVNSILKDHMTKYRNSIVIDEDFLRNNYVYVSVYFRTLSLETLKKSKGYLWFSLICDIGGSAGLYLGASLLAIAEVFWFFGSQLLYRLKRLRRLRASE
ncbi:acid-sensing ion channel 4-A-like [Tubulanus polymorphus]|uniref:acid-sensing ion channel 4-A-like n=1 Tax=Tubulanus polymorphus TaxID=672921 RepID=UPI003DA22EB0